MKMKKTALLLAAALLILPGCAPPEEEINYEEAFARGDQAFAAGDYEAAALELTDAMSSRDDGTEVWILRGDAYWELELYEDAVSDYEHALALDETLYDIYDRLAECYSRLGDPDVAAETLERRETVRREAGPEDAG
ncbi:MAG: tetratricopeptide repeat protein [Gracilibacteraceae bacterium]|jgi:tetratricopeptide (TPR) repeat protein|nr:tetratricopeptide repeat protein [Gracilibacteraceae bacterium]